METSAPKRRKTSPTANVPVNNSNAPVSSLSSNESGGRSTRRKRPSFASPTKASLARSNPDILRRRTKQGNQSSRSEAPAASEPDDAPSEHGSESDLVTAQLEAESEAGQIQDGSDSAQRPDSTPTRNRSPLRRAGGAMALRPRRTPNKPSPRPLPPPVDGEEELINPFRSRRGLRRSPPPGVLPNMEPEEPELPPTPTQQGLSDPSSVVTSPAGIHNTPSKRPMRSRVLAERMQSSPLKQPPLRPPSLEPENLGDIATSSKALFKKGRLSQGATRPQKKRQKSHPARNIEEVDPLADKRALKDSLLDEVAQLEGDLRLAARENERLYQEQDSTRGISTVPNPDEDTLLDLLQRYALPPEKGLPSDPIQNWVQAAMNPVAFLPFGAADLTLPPLFTAETQNDESANSSPQVSHHPISMTAEEELPYLQVFSPLTFTSTISTLPREDTDNPGPLMQKHVISISSEPPDLFAAKLHMTVNTKKLAIAGLSVPNLDSCASSELGPFIEKIIQGTWNKALTQNVSVVTWAMSEWVRLSTKRARFWCEVERDLGTEGGLVACAKAMRRGTKRRRPGRRPAMAESEEEDDDDDDIQPGKDEADKNFSKAKLLPQLGRTHLDLDMTTSGLEKKALVARIQWKIEFDWTGEAQSKIGLLLSAPAKWHHFDEKRSLRTIPDMFDKLIQENKDPMESLRTVVALVVGGRMK
ncbi:hypothetical protein F5Y15DRAFT_377421 [Xylariaceae sp. FL0016]|nr:hypothetical protein F5Y15DRAFT_377421 [Xylariaceae sp. FL0016]